MREAGTARRTGADRAGECIPLLGPSRAAAAARLMAGKAAAAAACTLVAGPCGSALDEVARCIHAGSAARAGPFVAFDCRMCRRDDQTLVNVFIAERSRELLQHPADLWAELLRRARGGTLYLREVQALPDKLQRALRHAVERRAQAGDGFARIVSSTPADARALLEAGRFDPGLYYRLAVMCVDVPALAERGPDDVAAVAEGILRRLRRRRGRRPMIDPAALAALRAHRWPGDFDELRVALQVAHGLSAGRAIAPADLPPPEG